MLILSTSNQSVVPAIDLRNNRCVRLRQGRAEAETVYSEDPVAVAHHWEEQGAEYLHVVDLDGAFAGRPVHGELVARMAASLSIPIEVGGGIRTDADIERLIEAGADRAIIGTRAFEHVDELGTLAARFGARLAVGIDARDGKVRIKGWIETTDTQAVTLAGRADALGVQTIIYTDTAMDGMLRGVNAPAVKEICDAVRCRVVASGGVSSAADIRKLRALDCDNLWGAVVGKALYDGKVTLPALHRAAA